MRNSTRDISVFKQEEEAKNNKKKKKKRNSTIQERLLTFQTNEEETDQKTNMHSADEDTVNLEKKREAPDVFITVNIDLMELVL